MNRYLPILCLLLLPAIAGADLNDGLIGSWELDGNALDSSTYGNHGNMVGGPTPCLDRHGNPTGALEFDGLSTWITVPHSTSISSPDSAVTMCAWVNFIEMSQVGQAFNPIFMKSTGGANSFMYRSLIFPNSVGGAVNNWFTSGSQAVEMVPSEWQFVVTIFDRGEFRNYRNGVLLGSSTVTDKAMVPNTFDLGIAVDTPGILEVYNGKLDDLRLYNRALSLAEIQELYGVATAAASPASASYLGQNSPNPFQWRTQIPIVATMAPDAWVGIYDLAGRLVRRLNVAPTDQAESWVLWDANDDEGRAAPSGVYFYRLMGVNGVNQGQRLILMR